MMFQKGRVIIFYFLLFVAFLSVGQAGTLYDYLFKSKFEVEIPRTSPSDPLGHLSILHNNFTDRPIVALQLANLQAETMETKPIQKSKGKAFILSLLLPGWGERYIGSHSKSQVFLGTEIAFWTGYAGFKMYGNWRKEDYKAFAAAHAGVDIDSKSGSYFTKLEKYATISEYNDAMLRDRNLRDYYHDIDQYFWNWDSEANRKTFRELRISADEANNRSLLMAAAIVANHLISAIDAMWTAHKYNKDLESSNLDFDVQFGGAYGNQNFSLKVTKRF